MRWSSLAVLAGLAATGSATTDDSGAVIDLVKPAAQNPEGCQDSYDGKFQIEVEPLASDKSESVNQPLERRADPGAGALVLELKGSVLTDSQKRTGYIASNYQFQFDGPPQAGSIYTGGFCVFNNGSLALGDTTVMYRCKSGDFYNLYDRNWAEQCDAIRIRVAPLDNAGSQQQAGGQNTVGTRMMATTMVTVLADGQPQVIQTEVPVPICQIGDGQIQAHTTPCAEAPVITSVSPAINPVSQISDGQPQAPSLAPAPAPVSQDETGAPVAPAPETSVPEQTAAPEQGPPPPPAEATPPPAPEASSAVSPAVEQPTSPAPTLETSARPVPTEAPQQSQAPSSQPSAAPVQAGAEMARAGPAASLITAVIGLLVFLY